MNAQLPALHIDQIPDAFFVDVAVGTLPFVEICDIYNIPATTVPLLESDALFQRRLRIAEQAVQDDGTAFRARCRSAVAESITSILHMINDSDVPPSTQLEAFKTLAKYGGLEPAKTEATQQVAGPGLTLNIVAPDGASFSFGAEAPTSTPNTTNATKTSTHSANAAPKQAFTPAPSLVIDHETITHIPKANKNVSTLFSAE